MNGRHGSQTGPEVTDVLIVPACVYGMGKTTKINFQPTGTEVWKYISNSYGFSMLDLSTRKAPSNWRVKRGLHLCLLCSKVGDLLHG